MNFKILNYELDNEQTKVAKDDSKYLFVLAGAGSGKTLTIVGKIKYLIENKHIKEDEIICITFTNMAVESLKEKIRIELNKEIKCYTFHKLAMEIISDSKESYSLADDELLTMIVENFFNVEIFNSNYLLKVVLKYFNNFFSTKPVENYKRLLVNKQKEVEILKRELITFIRLFKCGSYKLEDFKDFFHEIKSYLLPITYLKEKYFLLLAFNIYLLYEKEKQAEKELDFDDLLFVAREKVKNYSKRISYIIIDEYQDTSYVRFLLIKELVERKNCSLMVVGDDFQSIYRFSGCDISLFYNFPTYFPNSVTHKITTTYRNSQELITVAGRFILKNKYQLKKKLTSSKHLEYPLRVIYYKNKKAAILKILDSITSQKVFILGRNNNDIYSVLSEELELKNNKVIYKKKSYLDITFLTIHKSKGLEADDVIIINFLDDTLGFPNKIKEERIIRLVSKREEDYPYAEERRLFYVAITRTKNTTYLMVPTTNYSIFIKELERDYKRSKLVKFERLL